MRDKISCELRYMFFEGAKKTTTSENYMLFCYIRSNISSDVCRGCFFSSSFTFFCSHDERYHGCLGVSLLRKNINSNSHNKFHLLHFCLPLDKQPHIFSPFIRILRILRRLENLSMTSETKKTKKK